MTETVNTNGGYVWVIKALALCVLMTACGTSTRTEQDTKRSSNETQQTVTKEVITKVPLENGGERIERVLTSNVVSNGKEQTTMSESMATGLDQPTQSIVDGFGQMAGYAISTATANPSGALIGTGIAGLLTAAVTAWGASNSARAKQISEERDAHKADANEGWAKYEAAMKEKSDA